MGYNFEIFYGAVPENKAVDALSRIPCEAQLNVITVPFLLDVGVVEKEVQFGTKLWSIFDRVVQDPDSVPQSILYSSTREIAIQGQVSST